MRKPKPGSPRSSVRIVFSPERVEQTAPTACPNGLVSHMIWSFSRGASLAFLIALPSFLPAQEANPPAVEESAADGVGSIILETATETQTSEASSG